MSFALDEELELKNGTVNVSDTQLTKLNSMFDNINDLLKENNSDSNKQIKISENILSELEIIKQQLIQINSQNSNPNSISNMNEEELKKIFQDKTDQINTTLWKTTAISDLTSISLTLLGFALGLIGASLIDLGKEYRSKNDIKKLLEDDLLRIHNNIANNRNICKNLKDDMGKQHEFLNKIKTYPDIVKFQELGVEQAFNFWHTIISSTMLIKLKKEQIKNSQIVFDLLRKYNISIQQIMYAQNTLSTLTTNPLIPVLMNLLLENRNMTHAHTILTTLSTGLIPIHEGFLNITKTALISLGKKENELSM
ncbi:MAG: hypothetical protein WD717_07225 [Nitrosarchaeum sp.]